jgi:putative ATP-binding cassette transporter
MRRRWQRSKLERLVPLLDQTQRWDRELSEDEQQTLAFARVVLHAPPWVLIDEVLDSLDEETRQRILAIFTGDLEHTGVIHIGRANARDRIFSRVVHLVTDPTLRRLPAGTPAAAATAAPSVSTA